ncbi:MAG: phage/plasmid primase, P4 family [Thermoguttaceae bacterium]|jgi:putative DNA primase/helicase
MPDIPAATLPGILPHHLADLRKSGLTDATIQAAGIHSEVSVPKLAALLDWPKYRPSMGPAVVFPFTDTEGRNGYCRVKPDRPRTSRRRAVKYESPHGQPNQIYLPPDVAGLLADATRELLITEGEKKSLAATQAGFPCVGLVGVFGWKPGKKETLLPALERIAWQGRKVYVAFDNDGALNPDVQAAESRLAAHLAQRGAVVKVVRLPQGDPGADRKPVKVGLDDFLVACVAKGLNPAGELRRLLDAAEDPTEPDPGTMKQSAGEIDAVPEAVAFLTLSERDGVSRLRFWRDTWLYWRAGAYREMPPSEVRGRLVDYLDQGYCKLTKSAVGNVVEGLRAKARLSHRVEPPEWLGNDAPAWGSTDVLICRNGMVHLPSLVSGKADFLRPATPRLFAQVALDYDFRPDAPRPDAWLRFLDELWPDDAGSVSALQEWAGYLLTPDTRQQKILLTIGPRRSGKGTIGRVLRATIGKENVCGPTLASLSTNFGLWPLVGKSLAIVSDARLGGRTDSQIVVERLLSISGEDCLTIDRKNLVPWTGKLSTRLMIFTNELPRLGDSSGALAGRMILLRLSTSFYGREDAGLTDRLLTELPGILLWAVEGWRRLRARGYFVQPTAADELLTELNDLTSPVSVFVRECCNVGPEYEVQRGDLYEAYAKWAKEHGRQHVEDEGGFGRALRAALPAVGTVKHRIDNQQFRFYRGVALR